LPPLVGEAFENSERRYGYKRVHLELRGMGISVSDKRVMRPMTRHGMATYFVEPYQPYRRGGNDNRNGVICRHLPERSRIEPSMANDVQAIMDGINNRPMRMLGHRAPTKAFTDELLELTNEQGRCTSE